MAWKGLDREVQLVREMSNSTANLNMLADYVDDRISAYHGDVHHDLVARCLIMAAISEVSYAKATRARQEERDRLLKYARHKEDCGLERTARAGYPPRWPTDCTCGFAKVYRGEEDITNTHQDITGATSRSE